MNSSTKELPEVNEETDRFSSSNWHLSLFQSCVKYDKLINIQNWGLFLLSIHLPIVIFSAKNAAFLDIFFCRECTFPGFFFCRECIPFLDIFSVQNLGSSYALVKSFVPIPCKSNLRVKVCKWKIIMPTKVWMD